MDSATYQVLRKAWHVVGHTYEGSVYCLECCTNQADDYGNRPAPIFASDEVDGLTCDQCGKVID